MVCSGDFQGLLGFEVNFKAQKRFVTYLMIKFLTKPDILRCRLFARPGAVGLPDGEPDICRGQSEKPDPESGEGRKP